MAFEGLMRLLILQSYIVNTSFTLMILTTIEKIIETTY